MWRENLKKWQELPEYISGISLEEARKIAGPKSFLRLQSNENLFIPKDLVAKILLEASEEIDVRFYPKEIINQLTDEIAKRNSVNPSMVIIGSGADQLIELIVKALGFKGKVFLHNPTYSYYKVVALQNGLEVVSQEYINGSSINFKAINEHNPDVVFICNPNNPTGELTPKEEIKALAEEGKRLVVVDETYAELSKVTNEDLLLYYDNLIILRTFSKAYGLAGLRLGYALASEYVIKALRKAQSPFPVTSISAAAALKALEMRSAFEKYWEEALETRAWFVSQLDESVLKTKSASYFLTISFRVDQEKAFLSLLREGYVTRKIEPFGAFRNPIRLNLAPKELIENLPHLINKINSSI